MGTIRLKSEVYHYWRCHIIELHDNTIFVPTSQLQRHRPIVKTTRTKGCDVSTKNEQLDDMRTPVKLLRENCRGSG